MKPSKVVLVRAQKHSTLKSSPKSTQGFWGVGCVSVAEASYWALLRIVWSSAMDVGYRFKAKQCLECFVALVF